MPVRSVRPSNSSRLTVDDWLRAGFTLVAEEGLKALKIERLCEFVGVTKGSFYWHFDDIGAYRAALVSAWGEWRDEYHQRLEELSAVEPRARLTQMMAMLLSAHQWTLERAMREWARSDPAAAASVRASDRRTMRAVRNVFIDYGLDARTAQQRAEWTFAAGVGFLHLADSHSATLSNARRDAFVDFLLTTGEAPAPSTTPRGRPVRRRHAN